MNTTQDTRKDANGLKVMNFTQATAAPAIADYAV